MVSCCVINCDVTRRYNPNNYTFHRFPSQPELKQKWIRIIKRPHWSPNKNSTICSKHFEEKCFIQRKNRCVLMKNSVPTLFVPIILKLKRLPSSNINRDITIKSEKLEPPSDTTDGPSSNLLISPREKKLKDENTRLRKKILEKNKVIRNLKAKSNKMTRWILSLHEIIKNLNKRPRL